MPGRVGGNPASPRLLPQSSSAVPRALEGRGEPSARAGATEL
jgi:hypothetical protein